MNKQLLGWTMALATELSALIFAAYFAATWLAGAYGLDGNLLVAGLIIVALGGWFIHVFFIFKRYTKDSEEIPPHSN